MQGPSKPELQFENSVVSISLPFSLILRLVLFQNLEMLNIFFKTAVIIHCNFVFLLFICASDQLQKPWSLRSSVASISTESPCIL